VNFSGRHAQIETDRSVLLFLSLLLHSSSRRWLVVSLNDKREAFAVRQDLISQRSETSAVDSDTRMISLSLRAYMDR